MPHSDDHITLAAEYALGTLNADERAQVETMMSVDAEFTALVQTWQYRLGALNHMVGLVEPRPVLWDNIRSAIARAEPQVPPAFPEPEAAEQPAESAEQAAEPAEQAGEPAERPAAPATDASDFAASEVAPPEADTAQITPDVITPDVAASNVVALTAQARRWRGIARAVSAIAAALVALLGFQIFAPDLLPDALRPSVRTRVVEVKTPAPAPTPAAQYVALLQGQGGGPAFILTVDGATRSFTVRKVGASPAEPGKSYELWLISDRLPRPRSLGVIGNGDFTGRSALSSYDPEVVNNATFAVTVEQAGGSPDGVPHSAPVFSGRLIETVPAGAAAPAQQTR